MTESAAPEPIVEGRLALLRAQFPGKFGPEDEERIRTRIARSIALGVTMRATPLGNGEGPFFTPIALQESDRDA